MDKIDPNVNLITSPALDEQNWKQGLQYVFGEKAVMIIRTVPKDETDLDPEALIMHIADDHQKMSVKAWVAEVEENGLEYFDDEGQGHLDLLEIEDITIVPFYLFMDVNGIAREVADKMGLSAIYQDAD